MLLENPEWSDDFSDGDRDGWDAEGGSWTVKTNSVTNTTYSLYAKTDDVEETEIYWAAGPELDLTKEFTIRGVSYHEFLEPDTPSVRFGIINDSESNTNAMFNFQSPDSGGNTYLATSFDDTLPDDHISDNFSDEWIEWELYSDEGSSTLSGKVWNYFDPEPENYQLSREFTGKSGPFGIGIGTVNPRQIWMDVVQITGSDAASSILSYETGDPLLITDSSDQDFVYDGPSNNPYVVNSDSSFVFIQGEGVGVKENT